MNAERIGPDVSTLAERWWILAVRGGAALIFGILTLFSPQISLLTLMVLWGGYAVADGLFNLLLAARGGIGGRRWGWLTFDGAVSLLAGAATFFWPGLTALGLLVVIALWAVITGVGEIATEVKVRRQVSGEWMFAASGALSIIFGGAMLIFTRSGALALTWMIAAFAVSFGLLQVALGVRLRRWYPGETHRAAGRGSAAPG